ncbi:MAG: hypothetical protein JWO30_3222 [Fibrobacteres bacterium]|nr:hypothetical protein [Fibrobacterota bacterium]
MRALFILVLPAMVLAQTLPLSQAPKSPTQPYSQAPQDTLAAKVIPSTKDTLAVTPPKSRSDTVIVVKHAFNHREQIITGSVIMTCLALMLVTMNNYNPR